MSRSRFTRSCLSILCICLAVAVARAGQAGASPDVSLLPSGDQDAYVQACKMTLAGQFQQSLQLLSASPPSAPKRQWKLVKWLRDYYRIQQTAAQRRQEIYQENIDKAQKALADGKSEDALSLARKASYYAADKQQFRQLPWLEQIVTGAEEKASQYLQQHKWLDAGEIYYELGTIFEEDKRYEEMTRRCGRHARLEATYGAEEESENGQASAWTDQMDQWREDLAIISPDVVAETVLRIQHDYVEAPDLQALTIGGLKAVKILLETEKLAKTFPELADDAARRRFLARIDELIAQVKQFGEPFTEKQVWLTYGRLLQANQETVNLPIALVIKEFVEGLTNELDLFSSVIWPSERESFQKQTTGKFSGVGIQIAMEDNKLTVITPLSDTPAYRAGLAPGDIITAIDGKSTQGITIDQAVRAITGPKGTVVVLSVQHPWEREPVDIPLVRDTIVVHTVKGYQRDDHHRWRYFIDPDYKIAYIRVTSFTETTVEDLEKALKQARDEGMRALILDLRFNAGGLLRSANGVADLFLSNGAIVSTRGRNVPPFRRQATPGGSAVDVPMIVLVNDYSASASEIVAGALKDHARALLVGQRTFGKGSVQNLIPIADNTCWLKLTTALYYLPSGRSIHKRQDSKVWGVDPDIKIELTPNEMRDVIQLDRDRDIIRQNDNGPSTAPATKPATAATTTQARTKPAYPPVDIQLKAALLVMRVKLDSQQSWPVKPALAIAEGKTSQTKPLGAVQP